MPRAIDMRIVPLVGLVLDMCRRDRDAPRPLLRRLVALVKRHKRRPALLRQNLGDRRRQRRLAMIDVTDRPNIAVRLRPLKLRLRHSLRLSVRVRGARLQNYTAKAGAGGGNRTHVASLEGWSSTIELHPLEWPFQSLHQAFDPAATSRALVEGVGFEPTKTYVGRFTVCCL